MGKCDFEYDYFTSDLPALAMSLIPSHKILNDLD